MRRRTVPTYPRLNPDPEDLRRGRGLVSIAVSLPILVMVLAGILDLVR